MPKLEACSSSRMPSWETATYAMQAVNRELETHFENLSDPELQGEPRDAIGRFAAEGVGRGLYAIGIHQQLLSWQLDDLALEQALADDGLVEAD